MVNNMIRNMFLCFVLVFGVSNVSAATVPASGNLGVLSDGVVAFSGGFLSSGFADMWTMTLNSNAIVDIDINSVTSFGPAEFPEPVQLEIFESGSSIALDISPYPSLLGMSLVAGEYNFYVTNLGGAQTYIFSYMGDVAVSISAVPLPAAALLFGSALLGFIGYSKVRRQREDMSGNVATA